MKTAAANFRGKGPSTASLFVAYMLVLQSLAVGLVSTSVLRSGVFSNEICLNGAPSADDETSPAQPKRTAGHVGDQCCAFHCSGAGTPPNAAFGEERQAYYNAGIDWLAPPARNDSVWPTLPVGSRAPPSATFRDWA